MGAPPVSHAERAAALRRKLRAVKGGYALHEQHPDIAVRAGRRGGFATAYHFELGPSEWGRAMATRRWYGEATGFEYRRVTENGGES